MTESLDASLRTRRITPSEMAGFFFAQDFDQDFDQRRTRESRARRAPAGLRHNAPRYVPQRGCDAPQRR